jgi:hypothetical protein
MVAGRFQPNEITLHESGRPYLWVVREPLTWEGELNRQPVVLTANPDSLDFVTDLASVPRWLTWLFPRYGLYTKAAVLHDYLCQNLPPDGQLPPSHLAGVHDRTDADEVFRNAMRAEGVPIMRRWLMWSAVNWATLVGRLMMRRLIGAVTVVVVAAVAFVSVRAGAVGSLHRSASGSHGLRVAVAVTVVLLAVALAVAGSVTLLVSLWWPLPHGAQRGSRVPFVVAAVVLAAGLVVGIVALVQAGPGLPFVDRRWPVLGVAAVAGAATIVVGAVVAVAGLSTLGRWDRWWNAGRGLLMTASALPLLAGGLGVLTLLAVYLVLEDVVGGLAASRQWLVTRRRAAEPVGPFSVPPAPGTRAAGPSPKQRRRDATRASAGARR